MNVQQAISHLESRVGPREQTGIQPEDVEDWVPTALERTKEFAASSGSTADFEREDSLALDGSGAATIPTDALAGRIAHVRHTSSSFNFTRVSNKAELQFIFTKQFGHFAVEDGKIWTVPPLIFGDPPLTGNLLVTFVVPMALGSLPSKFEPYFLDRLTELAQGRLTAHAPSSGGA